MTGKPSAKQPAQPKEPSPQVSSLESFVRLQQHQAEYLKWLEASEKKADIDRYTYKKIR